MTIFEASQAAAPAAAAPAPPPPAPAPPLRSPQNFINREISALEFNQRVLAQSLDPRVPLLERLNFLCISSSNLDEFFEIRVAGIKQLLELGSTTIGADGLGLAEQLSAIHARAKELVRDQYACLNDVLLPALRETGIDVLDAKDWDTQTRAWVEHHFAAEVEPVLSPLGLDPARPFPRIQNKSLNFIVRLSGKDAYGRDSELAIVQAPRSLPRILALPASGSETITPTAVGPQTYTLTCSNLGGPSAAANVTLTATPNLVIPAAPTLTLGSASIPADTTTTISWSSSNATSCTAGGSTNAIASGWTGVLGASGQNTVTPVTLGTFTYTLYCTNAAGKSPTTTVNLTVTESKNTGGGGALDELTLAGLGVLGLWRALARRKSAVLGG